MSAPEETNKNTNEQPPQEQPAQEEQKQKPEEDVPAEDKPAEEEKKPEDVKPAEDKPAEEEKKPEEDVPAEDKPAEEEKKPEDDKPAEDKPAEEEKKPEDEKPAEDLQEEPRTPEEEKPAEDKPEEEAAPETTEGGEAQAKHPEEPPVDVIWFYTANEQPYGCFSNFFRCKVEIDGRSWPDSEHYYQAMKFESSPEDFEAVAKAEEPLEAAMAGRDKSRPLREDWEQVKNGIMWKVVYAKFSQNPEIMKILIDSGDQRIVEHTNNDSYWGDNGDGSGKNMLGLTLASVRARIIKENVCPEDTLWFSSPEEEPYGCFTNFFVAPFQAKEMTWQTAEHYYQAMKFESTEEHVKEINAIESAQDAATAGRDEKRPLREDWEDVREQVMLDALYAKFSQNPELAGILMETHPKKLVGHTTKHDYWGDMLDGSGQNRLGELLDQTRALLIKEEEEKPTEKELALMKEIEETEASIAAADEIINNQEELIKKTKEAQAENEDLEKVVAEKQTQKQDLDAKNAELEKFLLAVGDLDELESRITSLEDMFKTSRLGHLWDISVEQDRIIYEGEERQGLKDQIVGENANKLSFEERLINALNLHEHECHRAEELMVKCDQEKMLANLERDRAKQELVHLNKNDMTYLDEVRKHLKVVEAEQNYHIRRGTHIKDKPKNKEEDTKGMRAAKESEVHNQICAEIVEAKQILINIKAEVQDLHYDIRTTKKEGEKQKMGIKEEISALSEEAEEVEWERGVIQAESDDLKGLKQELLATLSQVRQFKKLQ